MVALFHDVRFAVRTLWREKGFASTVVLMTAVGIGATTAIFTIINGVLLQPLALPEADRVVAVHRPDADGASIGQPDAIDIRGEVDGLVAFGIVAPEWSLDMIVEREPVHVAGALVESGYFEAVGLTSVIGRLIQPADDDDGAQAVAVLGESFWRRRFDADSSVVGRTISISDVPTTIIGVAPNSADVFHGGVEAWVNVAPFAPWAHEARGSNNFSAVARLAPGVSLEAANRELAAFTANLTASYPDTNAGKTLVATPLGDFLVSGIERALWMLLGAVGLVLLISTANVASLMLVRSARRVREIGIRQAIGAGRGRIVRQLITEGLVVSLVGGAGGVSLLLFGFGTLKRFAPPSLPRLDEVQPDVRVLLFAIGLAVVTGVLCSLAPVWRLRRTGATTLSGATRGVIRSGDRRVLAPLVIGEIALALVLLAGTGLLLRSFSNLVAVPLGYEPANVAMGVVVLPDSRYSEPEPQTAAFSRMVDAMRSRPGVVDAAFMVGAPQSPNVIGHALEIDGRSFSPEERPGARYRPFIGDPFGVLGMHLVRGRTIPRTDQQATERHEAIVNERFVQRYFRDEDPIGKRIAWRPDPGATPSWMTIVGVVADVKGGELRAGDPPAVYAPYLQRDDTWIRFGTLLARMDGNQKDSERAMQIAVSTADPLVPLDSFSTMPARLDKVLARDRFSLELVSLFGVVALLLSVQGIFGVVAYDVAQRRAELGLRMAVGARSADVFRLVLRRGADYALLGVLVGSLGALGLTHLLESLLFDVSTKDPFVLVGSAIVLAFLCMTAAIVPALRASRIAPASILRDQ